MPFRRTLLLAPLALAATSLPAHAEVNVIASIKPVHSLVASVMKGAGAPSLIIDGAGSPHTYSLKPSQASALQDADVVFWIGESLEAFLDKPISTIGAGTMAVELIETPGLELLPLREGGAFESHMHEGEEGDQEHEHEHAEDGDHVHGEVDMHAWLDPENAAAMAREIAERLSEADPDNAELYRKNAAALASRLDELTAELSAELGPVKDKGFIVFHDGYQYFEHRFGLSASGSITVSPDVMPGADRLAEVRAKVRDMGATCVFAEPQFEPKLISVVTEEGDVRSGVLDPLGAGLEAGPDLYFELIRQMATSFETCLAGAS